MDIGQVQIRMGEMAAEIDRLNAEVGDLRHAQGALIDRLSELTEENNSMRAEREQLLAQEPVEIQYRCRTGGWQQFLTETHKKETIQSGQWEIRNLYARPIPAQQSCAGCGNDDKGLALYCVKCIDTMPPPVNFTVMQSLASLKTEVMGLDSPAYAIQLIERIEAEQQSPAVPYPTPESYELELEEKFAHELAVPVPDFLLEMSKQMRTQDNRGTSHPFFQVRCKRYIVTEQGYNEAGYELCTDDGVIYRSYAGEDGDLERLLIEDYPEFCEQWRIDQGEETVGDAISSFDPTEDDLPEGVRLVYVQEAEEIVSTHLTESGAYQFIARKQHDYPKLYTYAESAYWSPQLRQLQDWIISLSGATAPSPRITEQDAREIGLSSFRHLSQYGGRTVDTWLEEDGRALLDKLNGKPESAGGSDE